jgi:ABC-2 type transport system permease protein
MTAARRDAVTVPRSTTAPAPGWWVVAGQEFRDLWLSWRGPMLALAFSVLLSLLTFLAATNKDLNFIDQKDTVNLVMQVTLGIGVAISLLVSADALSGERERGTLETLLLTPLPTRQIVMGKLLAALSVWPAILVIAIPYIWALRIGPGLFTDAVLSGAVVGALLTITFASLGIIVSIFSSSNRVSLAASFFIFVALLTPTQLPGGALKGWFGDLLIRVNPVTAGARFVDRIIVSNHSWGQESSLLISPVIAAIVGLVVVYLLSERLQLRGGIRG